MDYYFAAPDDSAALEARHLASGPTPDSKFHSVEAKDVMACPHLEQLVELASGKKGPSLVPQLKTLWPEPVDDPADYVLGASLMRLPDGLRDDLAQVEVTPDVAAQWAGAIWGFDPDHAGSVATAISGLARRARETGEQLYWWSEM
jgi:hypothetical protein